MSLLEISGVCVQGFARQREVGFAERLGLGRMRVHQVRDVVGGRLPVVDQLGLTDLLAPRP